MFISSKKTCPKKVENKNIALHQMGRVENTSRNTQKHWIGSDKFTFQWINYLRTHAGQLGIARSNWNSFSSNNKHRFLLVTHQALWSSMQKNLKPTNPIMTTNHLTFFSNFNSKSIWVLVVNWRQSETDGKVLVYTVSLHQH